MTTLDYSNETEQLFQRLDMIRMRRWTVQVTAAAFAVWTILLVSAIAVAAAAGYWPDQPPTYLRWALLLAAGVIVLGAFALILGRALLWKQNPAQLARFVEEHLPQVRNDLINTVLFTRDPNMNNPELVQLAIHEAVRRTERMDLESVISYKPMKRWGIAAGLSTTLLVAFIIFQSGPFLRGLKSVMSPGGYVRSLNTLELVELTPRDKTIFAGEPLTIMAKIRNDLAKPLAAEVRIEGVDTPRPMSSTEAMDMFALQMSSVDHSFNYSVHIGASRWPEDKPFYTVTVIKKVEVEGLDVRYEYLPYTGLEAKTVTNADGMIEAPLGSQVTLTLRLKSPVPAVALAMQDEPERPMTAALDRKSFTAIFPVAKDGGYRILLKDPSGHIMQQLPDAGDGDHAEAYSATGQILLKGMYRVHALPDSPPKIEFLAPNRDVTVSPGGKVTMKIKASDNYGLTAVALRAGLDAKDKEPQLADVQGFQAGTLAGKKETEISYTFDVSEYKENDVVVYQAMATDNRKLDAYGLIGHQTTPSSKFKITIQDAGKLASEKAKRYEELNGRILALLRMQEKQLVQSQIGQRKATMQLADVKTSGANILAGQRAIKAEMVDIVEKFPFDQEMLFVQQALAMLANNEAQTAIDQSQVLTSLADLGGKDKAYSPLIKTQAKILETLQSLVGEMTRHAGKQETATKPAKGAEMPPEVQEKLKKLEDSLQEFAKEERKVIEAADRLAKKPADAFTGEDMKTLNDLVAVQDKWENFMNQAITDLSKLATQDFSNPVAMKELVSVKSDVTMAKDALKEKATEIATPAEENGIENAKSLTANLEKWLPDKPDRQKWSMEDPGDGQANVEAAELPTELEDLVGDLLEQEEDLFNEMEDLNSKYAQSGDKGIGWDAADGPISNMNAQGVTGNQLPNANELQGRSGEGRTGQSSGEFVEDKAVGKGGRKTPTRLTNEGFQKAEVNDQSKDAPGGATGGGKISGQGEEGLEGPVPPPLEKEMQRLAGKQAALANRAERIQAQFQQNDHGNVKMLQTITLMNKVRNDLENYRYNNVLRGKKETLESRKDSKLMLSGKMDVTTDTTSTMPKRVRDDISDAMKGKVPDEYRDVLEQYYRRLSEQGGR